MKITTYKYRPTTDLVLVDPEGTFLAAIKFMEDNMAVATMEGVEAFSITQGNLEVQENKKKPLRATTHTISISKKERRINGYQDK